MLHFCWLCHWFFKFLQRAKIGETLDRAYCGTGFEETLRQCQEAVKTFRGSEETLKCIQRIEECLRKLVDESN